MGRTTELRRTALYVVATIMAGFGLTSVASAQSYTNTSGSWSGTSSTVAKNNCSITNKNNVSVHNSNVQSALSGNAVVADNGPSGLSWGGWDALSPTNAQAQGDSYGTWYNGVVNWISNRANGTDWAGAGTGSSWAPGGNDWASFDPMAWQANGQSFGNWYNGAESYLNSNSPAWLLGWPSSDTASGALNASTGSATNNTNANFSININNAASSRFGASTCGQGYAAYPSSNCPCNSYVAGAASNLAQPGSQGAGPESSANESVPASTPGYGSGSGNGFFGPAYGSQPGYPPTSAEQSSVANNSSANCPPPPPCGCGSSSGAPKAAPSAAITKTTVTNTNVVNVSNVSSQSAVTGNSVVSNDGNAAQSGSGNAANGNGTGLGADLSN